MLGTVARYSYDIKLVYKLLAVFHYCGRDKKYK